MVKFFYIVGLLCFVGSCVSPSVPNEMTSSEGEHVAHWLPPGYTHMKIALEPLLQILEYLAEHKNPNEPGDGFEAAQAKHLSRILYSVPSSFGWITILLTIAMARRLWIKRTVSARLCFALQAAGLNLCVAAGLLAHDFYRDATTYEGYFHLGLGAYLLLTAYLLIGISLVLNFFDGATIRCKRALAFTEP